MNNWQSFIVCMTAILAVVGYFWYDRYLDSIDSSEKNKTLRAAIEAIEKRSEFDAERISHFEKSLKALSLTFDENDKIKFPQAEKELTAYEMRQFTPKRAKKIEETTTYADGIFTVLGRHYDNDQIIIDLEQHGIKFDAKLDFLDENDQNSFIDIINKKERNESLPFVISLQINIIHTGKRIKYGFILGKGQKRQKNNIKTLDTIL